MRAIKITLAALLFAAVAAAPAVATAPAADKREHLLSGEQILAESSKREHLL